MQAKIQNSSTGTREPWYVDLSQGPKLCSMQARPQTQKGSPVASPNSLPKLDVTAFVPCQSFGIGMAIANACNENAL